MPLFFGDKMDKKQLINFINLATILLALVIIVLISALNNFNEYLYYSFSIGLAAIGVINLVFIAIKEAILGENSKKKYNIVPHSLHVVFGVLCYYLLVYLGGYDKYNYIYWIGFVLAIIIPIIVYLVIDIIYQKKHKNSNNGPKFIVNKNR